MNAARKSTLKNGNPIIKPRNGRAEVNNVTKELRRLGEERVLSLYKLHCEMAEHGEDENNRRSAQQFLLDKVLPKAVPGIFVSIPIKNMNSIEDIKENEKIIMQKVCDGGISIEAGEKLYAMTDQARKTYEASEITRMIEDIQKRMEDNGI